MIGGLHAPMCPNHPIRRDDRIACQLAQHRCLLYVGYCRQHRRVWSDLVPIEQYSNGGEGRHHMRDNWTTDYVFSVPGIVRRNRGLTTTTKESD